MKQISDEGSELSKPSAAAVPCMRKKRTFLAGQYSNPLRFISFNADEGWSRGISAEVATEVRCRYDLEMSQGPHRYPGLHGNARRHSTAYRGT
jgi:hypothetical protein